MSIIALEYHDVVAGADWDSSGFPGEAAASYKLSDVVFMAQLDVLSESGRRVGADVHAALADPEVPHVLLTFDDGGASALTVIGPALASRGWRAHLFVPTDRIGTPGFVTVEGLRNLQRAGHVIGSHSATHPTRMSRLSAAALRAEWRGSIALLEDILGERVTVASVPGGYYSRPVAEAASEAGVRALFTSEPVTAIETVASCAVIGRFTLRRWHSARYAASLAGRRSFARYGQWIGWSAKKLLKRTAGDAYLRWRAATFERASR